MDLRAVRRATLAIAGVAAVVTAFPAATLLAGESWSPGVAGFWLLVALPGLMLLAEAASRFDGFRLAPLVPAAFLLLALDVTDSASRIVVIGAWAVAAVAAVVVCALAALAYRRVTPAG